MLTSQGSDAAASSEALADARDGHDGPAPAKRPVVRCRRIGAGDERALAGLLARGFPTLSVADWEAATARARAWHEAKGLPGVGFVIEDGGDLVGVLLTLYEPGGRRCNLSSWYVDAGYRRYGTMLVSAALRDRSITYVNISPERHTWPIIEAQGFRRYADGVVAALPLLSPGPRERVLATEGEPPPGVAVEASDRMLMEHHAALGCIALWCVVGGRAHPFVFARRRVRRMRAAQVVHCPEGVDWRLFARAAGRVLARHGLFVLVVDAAGPLPGLTGRFLPGRMPKYARGPTTPRLGDLAYTEAAMFGT